MRQLPTDAALYIAMTALGYAGPNYRMGKSLAKNRRALETLWAEARRRATKKPVDFGRISGQAGGVAYVPDECKPKDETGSPDDMYVRVKTTERAIPEENFGFADHRPLTQPNAYDMSGYG